MSEGGGLLIPDSGEMCPGCQSTYTYEIGNFVMKTARIIPGCSHNLCEDCIVTEGTDTGQVTCRSPGCSNKVLWTDRIMEDFLPNLFILGSVAYRQQSLPPAPNGESADTMENQESKDDNCEMMCGECGDATADCLCQQCNINLCEKCFDKIHKLVKSFAKHKSLPIATDFIEKKMVRFLKMTNCNEHSKMIQYVSDDGTEGCDECVIFGKLKGLHVVLVKEIEEKARNDLKEKVVQGKDRLDQLRSILSDLESEKDQEMRSSPEKLTEKIKTHFFDCHSRLQMLEQSLYQKLKKDHIEFNAWKEEKESSVKSTATKIKELADLIKFSEEALSKDFIPGIYDFNEMVKCLKNLEDDPCVVPEITKPNSRWLTIEEGFKNRLDSHITLSENNKSRISSGSSGNHHNKLLRYANSIKSLPPVKKLWGNVSKILTVDDDITALNEDDGGPPVDTTSENLGCCDIDEVQSQLRSVEKNTVKKFKPFRKGQRANCSSHAKSTPEKRQDGNYVNLCGDVKELDTRKIRTLKRKREGSDDEGKPPASKKARNPSPSRSKRSNIVSDIFSSNENMGTIKPRSSKKVMNLMPSRRKDTNVSSQSSQNESTTTDKLCSSKIVKNQTTTKSKCSDSNSDSPPPNEDLNKTEPSTSKKSTKQIASQSSGVKSISEKTRKVSNDWRDCCKTKCKICNEVFTLTAMKTHTKTKHNLKLSKYKEVHGPLAIIEVVYHKCQICGKFIFLDRQYLGDHVRNHSMKIGTYASQHMITTTKLDLNQNKCKLSQEEKSSHKSKRQVNKRADKTQIVQSNREEARTSSGSTTKISECSLNKSKTFPKESEARLIESQPSRGKNPNEIKRRYRPGKAALMETRKFHKTSKILVPKAPPFFKLIKEATRKVIDVNKRSFLKIEVSAIDCLGEVAEARWNELIVDALYIIRAKRNARFRKDVILASKIGGAGDRF